MSDWDSSMSNPLVLKRLKNPHSDHNHGDGQDGKSKEITDHDDQDHKKKPWVDKVIIGQMNPYYIAYNIFICILCIASSYYYASFIGFRYVYDTAERGEMIRTMIIFETFFFIHFILQFFLEYQIEGYPPVRNIAKIAMNYVY